MFCFTTKKHLIVPETLLLHFNTDRVHVQLRGDVLAMTQTEQNVLNVQIKLTQHLVFIVFMTYYIKLKRKRENPATTSWKPQHNKVKRD